jgi:hypothetical protein
MTRSDRFSSSACFQLNLSSPSFFFRDPQAGDVPTLVDTCVLAGEILESLVMLHPKSCELVASSVFLDKGRAWARLFQVTDKFSLPLAKILYQCFATCKLTDSDGNPVKFPIGGFADKLFSALSRFVKDLAARELLAGECLEERLITLLTRRFQLYVSARYVNLDCFFLLN